MCTKKNKNKIAFFGKKLYLCNMFDFNNER